MFTTINHKGKIYKADLSLPIDISIPLRAGEQNVNAWNAAPVKMEPVRVGNWIGEVSLGGSVNFRNIAFNPHGNGTHTECVGHISKEMYSINKLLKKFFFISEVISILPDELANGDLTITAEHIQNCIGDKRPEALIIRTISNPPSKIDRQYSGTNPPYITEDGMRFIVTLGVEHLLVDVPSVDKEKDGGKVVCHQIFWDYPDNPLFQKTITELIYVPNDVLDGTYLLNLQIASFENDVAPSKPVLYKIVM